MCQIFLESAAQTKSHQSVSITPPPSTSCPLIQVCDLVSFSLPKQTIIFANRQHLCDENEVMISLRVKSVCVRGSNGTLNLKFKQYIFPEVSQLLFQTCTLLKNEMGGSAPGWSRSDSGSGPFVCGQCLLGFLQVLQFPPTVQEPEHRSLIALRCECVWRVCVSLWKRGELSRVYSCLWSSQHWDRLQQHRDLDLEQMVVCKSWINN